MMKSGNCATALHNAVITCAMQDHAIAESVLPDAIIDLEQTDSGKRIFLFFYSMFMGVSLVMRKHSFNSLLSLIDRARLKL